LGIGYFLGETIPSPDPLIIVTEETVKTGGSDIQTHGSKAPSRKPPATDRQLLQDILELTARNELAEAHRRLNKRAHARLDDFLKAGIVPEDLKRSG